MDTNLLMAEKLEEQEKEIGELSTSIQDLKDTLAGSIQNVLNVQLKKQEDMLEGMRKSMERQQRSDSERLMNEKQAMLAISKGTRKQIEETVASAADKAKSKFEEIESEASYVDNRIRACSSGIDRIIDSNFRFLGNALIYIFIGGVIFCMGYGLLSFFGERKSALRELAAKSAVESIQKRAVQDYRNSLLEDYEGGVELYSLVKEWDSRHSEFWNEPEEIKEVDADTVENLRKWAEKERSRKNK